MVRVFFPTYDPSGQVEFVVSPSGLILGVPNQHLRQTKNTGDYDVGVRINVYGFRDAKDIATARFGDIVVVGDSFAFGWGVEEHQRFSNVLQNLLQRKIFNIAIGSTNFEHYDNLLKYAESLGARIDNVVIAVCMENDLFAYGTSRQPVRQGEKRDDASYSMRAVALLKNTKDWLTHNSALYRMFTTAVQQRPWLKDLAIRAKVLIPNLDGISTNAYSPEVIERSADRLAEIAGRYKHAVILIIPSRALWVGNNRSVENRVHRAFTAALAARHLDVTDMRAVFESGGQPLSNHFRNDGHWNSKGHRLAAEALARGIYTNSARGRYRGLGASLKGTRTQLVAAYLATLVRGLLGGVILRWGRWPVSLSLLSRGDCHSLPAIGNGSSSALEVYDIEASRFQ